MVPTIPSPQSEADPRSLTRPKLRSDLVAAPQEFRGKPFFILKDPLSSKYFRLPERQYHIICLLDGRNTLQDILRIVQEHEHGSVGTGDEMVLEDLQDLVLELGGAGFLDLPGPMVRARMQAATQRRNMGLAARFSKSVGSALFFQIPLFNPDPMLDRFAKRLAWLWTPRAFQISLLIIAAGAVSLALHADRFVRSFGTFFSLENIFLAWGTTILIKCMHELGHGLTCRHFGVAAKETGLMFMAYSPVFYVDVSDSYLLPNRRHRMMIIAAGIYVELVIASVCAVLWATSQPGLFRQIMFNTVLITSFWTLAFNGNPLMRFDGYYFFSEWIQIPNLRSKSQALLARILQRIFLGPDPDGHSVRTGYDRQEFVLLAVYGVLSYLYSILITVHIAQFVSRYLTDVRLAKVGTILATTVIIALIMVPPFLWFRQLRFSRDDFQGGGRLRRAVLIVLGFLGLAALILCLPIERTINRAAILRPLHAEVVRAAQPGTFEQHATREGEVVKKGAVLVQLRNDEIESSYQSALALQRAAALEVQLALGKSSPSALKQSKAKMTQADTALARAARAREELTIRSNLDGVVLSSDLQRIQTGGLKMGDEFCSVAQVDPLQVYIPVAERDVRHVKVGQAVDFRSLSFPGENFHGVIRREPRTVPTSDIPQALTELGGGDVRLMQQADGKMVPADKIFVVLVELANPDNRLHPGMPGRARIKIGRHSIAELLKDWVLQFVDLDYRL